jgi:hypothetical protein
VVTGNGKATFAIRHKRPTTDQLRPADTCRRCCLVELLQVGVFKSDLDLPHLVADAKNAVYDRDLSDGGRKRPIGGRKKPSRSKGGRKIGVFPYPPYTFHIPPLSLFYTRYLSPICVRQGKKIDRDRVFASAICVRLASAVTQVASANCLTMSPS